MAAAGCQDAVEASFETRQAGSCASNAAMDGRADSDVNLEWTLGLVGCSMLVRPSMAQT